MLKDRLIINKPKKLAGGFFKVVTLLVVGSSLAACTIGPVPTYVPTNSPAPRITVTPAPTLPVATLTPAAPPAAPTLRPTLEATPSGLKLDKRQVLQEGFDFLLRSYFSGLSSTDVFEVGLRGIKKTLESAGIANPQVPMPNFTGNNASDLELFLSAYSLVVSRYGSQVSEEKLAYGALQTTANSLRECQTNFYPPEAAREHLANRLGVGASVGIGVNVQAFDNGEGLYITRVIPNSPSAKAGLVLGDVIQAVDGKSLSGKSLSEAVQILLGGKNKAEAYTQVTITVKSVRNGTTKDFTLTRAATRSDWLEARYIQADNIGYLRFNSLPVANEADLKTLIKQLDDVLAEFNSRKVSGLVIDMRGTRWGSIGTMQNIVSRFVSGSELVYLRAKRSTQSQVITLPSLANVPVFNHPLALLVDNGTTNEAEIFAQIFKQNTVGQIFGEPTAGCVAASSPGALPDNSVLNVAAYRAVSNPQDPASIVEQVIPDTEVDFDLDSLKKGQDAVLVQAVAFLKGQKQP